MQLSKLKTTGLFWLWISIIIIALDQFTKLWVLSHLTLLDPLKVFPFFNLTLAYNRGASFGFLSAASGWQNFFFCTLASIVSIVIVTWLAKITRQDWWVNVGLCLVVGGALGNVIDRLMYGYVVDFLSFHFYGWYFAIFNVADSAICVGTFMLIVYWLRQKN